MARVLRLPAGAGLPLLTLALAGCGDPISNAVLYEEARFRRALPSVQRFGAPSSVLLAPNGNSRVLAAAKQSAAVWDDWWGIAVAGGERLRESEASENSELKRAWSSVNVVTGRPGAAMGFDEEVTFWVQGEISLVDDEAARWHIAVAPAEDGPWTEVGSGLDAVGGGSTVQWDLTATARTLGGEPPYPLGNVEARYADPQDTADGLREVEATVSPYPTALYLFALRGDQYYHFVWELDITTDGETWPAELDVFHGEDGGWARGVVVPYTISGGSGSTTVQSIELSFQSCWNAEGNLLWQGGDEGIVAQGVASDCSIPDPF